MKHVLRMTFSCMLVVGVFVVESQAGNYRDDFQDNRHRWLQEEYSTVWARVQDGAYEIGNTSDEDFWHYTRETLLEDQFDYEVSAALTVVSGSASGSAGLVVAATDYRNYYGLHVSPDGRVTMDGRADGEHYSIVLNKVVPGVHKSGRENVLRLQVSGGNITGYVNGIAIGSYEYTPTGGANIGFEVYHRVLVKVNWVEVRDPVIDRTADDFFVGKYRRNLGPVVNTDGRESCPVVTADGKRLYFARTGLSEAYADLWYADRLPDGSFATPQRMPAPINNADANWALSVSQDNNSIVLAGEYRNGETFQGFSIVEKTARGWGYPQNLEVEEHYSRGDEVSYFMSSDRSVLVLGVQRDDTRGKDDLYVSFRNDDGTYSEPESLGDDINGPEDEMTPFLAPDNVTLYFSSKSYEDTYGNADVYVTRRLDDSWKRWSKPENLGPTVNSADWDAYFTVSADGNTAYVVSYLDSYGKSDILQVRLNEDAKPSPLLMVRGTVVDAKTGEPLSANVVYTDLATSEVLGRAISDPETGNYQVVLNRGRQYVIGAQREDYFPITEHFDVRTLEQSKELVKNLELAPIEIGQQFRLNNVYFETGKATLRPESQAELNELVRALESTSVHLRINGHTDDIGSEQDNLALSQARAQSVMEYLIDSGIDEDRLSAIGFGESQPTVPNDSDENRAFNRRVECEFVE